MSDIGGGHGESRDGGRDSEPLPYCSNKDPFLTADRPESAATDRFGDSTNI